MVTVLRETLKGTTVSGTATFTVTTDLVPDDLVILLTSKTDSGVTGSVTPAGLGTWSSELLQFHNIMDENRSMELRTLTGVTGTGSVTLTVGSTSSTYASDYTVYVVSGLPDGPVFDVAARSDWPDFIGTAGPLSVRADQFVVAAFSTFNTTNPFVFDPPWVPDDNVGRLGVAHQIPTIDGPVSATAGNETSTAPRAAAIISFGAPVEARMQQAFVETLVGAGDPPNTAITGVYAETLNNSAVQPDRHLHSSGLEVMFTDGKGTSRLSETRLEVLATRVYTPPTGPGAPVYGWGVSLSN